MADAQDAVSLVVVSFAKTPFRAAQPPLAMAYMSHCALGCDIGREIKIVVSRMSEIEEGSEVPDLGVDGWVISHPVI